MSGKFPKLKTPYICERHKNVKHFVQMTWQNRLVIRLGNAEILGAETSSEDPASGMLTCLQCSRSVALMVRMSEYEIAEGKREGWASMHLGPPHCHGGQQLILLAQVEGDPCHLGTAGWDDLVSSSCVSSNCSCACKPQIGFPCGIIKLQGEPVKNQCSSAPWLTVRFPVRIGFRETRLAYWESLLSLHEPSQCRWEFFSGCFWEHTGNLDVVSNLPLQWAPFCEKHTSLKW